MSQENLLQSKLFIPVQRRHLVGRPRLQEKLANILNPETRLSLVCAPAGFGKTTLIREWISSLEDQKKLSPKGESEDISVSPPPLFAWLSLEKTDNDPLIFWRYFCAALGNIDADLTSNILPALYAPQPQPVRVLLNELVNEILKLKDRFILVLDDYHLIENNLIHQELNYLLEHLPPNAHLLISTRSDPPLQLARRRAMRELNEVRAADLRFTHAETTQFLNEIMVLELSQEDIQTLETRTEGWIAGLQMAAISLRDTNDPHFFVKAFSGDDRYIADYLLEEVLQRQPAEFQEFLKQTSILERFCAPLCDAVTGRSDSQNILNLLERSNLFIIPLDNRREWFRYHHLFAHLLQQRLLDSSPPENIRELKIKASRWHADQGYISESVEIAFSCEDYEQVILLIFRFYVELFTGYDLYLLRQWAERLPEKFFMNNPNLAMMISWASHATGHPEKTKHYLHLIQKSYGITAEEFLNNPQRAAQLEPLAYSALLETSVILARLAVDDLELDTAILLGERIQPYILNANREVFCFNLPDDLNCVNIYTLALANFFRGNLDKASVLFEEARADAQIRQNLHIIALSTGHLGEVQILQGFPELALKTFQDSIHKEDRQNASQSSAFWGIVLVGQGEIAFTEKNYKKAEKHYQDGIRIGKLWNNWECLLPGLLGLAKIQAIKQDWEQANALLDNLLELTSSNTIMVRPAVEAHRALFQFQQGDLISAGRWAAAFDTQNPAPFLLQWEQSALIAAQIFLAQGQKGKTAEILERLEKMAETGGRGRTIQQIRQIRHSSPLMPAGHGQLIEPLSERELEVLQLMAEGLTNPEIARKLYLSPNTLKAHAQNIYQKLDVHNRMEAVNKGRAWDLI